LLRPSYRDDLQRRASIGELRLDLVHRQVSVGGTTVHLTPIEYRLLVALAQQAGKVLTHPQLLKQV